MAITERLYQFDTKAVLATTDILYCGNSVDSFNEVQTTVAGLIGAYPGLLSIGGLTTAANEIIYTTGSNVFATAAITAWALSLITESPASHTLPVAVSATGFTYKTLTNGQLLIGSTGADPVPATITPGTGITVTNTAGSIAIAATGSVTGAITQVNGIAYTTSSGTYTPTSGMEYIIVEMVGGGGGGGGSAASAGNSAAGGGGGASSYLRFVMTAADVGDSLDYTVGTGGTAGNTSGSNGGNGVSSVFGDWTATSGSGGIGATGSTTYVTSAGGIGGTSVQGTGTVVLDIAGESGGAGISAVPTLFYCAPGYGASTLLGGASITTPAVQGAPVLNTASGYGSGGGGGGCINGTSLAGLPGLGGVILITEYING